MTEIAAAPAATTDVRAVEAATMVVTYPTRRGTRVILIRRPAFMRRHPGQIAFPGGMVELTDASPLAAAIREAREEVGLRLPANWPARPLLPVGTITSGIVIQPFWVELPASPRLHPAPDEVAAILRVPLAELRSPGVFSWVPHPRRPGDVTPAFTWRGEVIWGATARTVVELLGIEGEAPALPPVPQGTERG